MAPAASGGGRQWLSGKCMNLTHRNAQTAGCGCRVQDTGAVKGQMRDTSQTIAPTAGRE